jgi:GNAT superfamily N-acetyltransferase
MIRLAEDQDIEEMLLLLQQLFAIEEDFFFDAQRQRKGLELLLDCPGAAIMVAEKQLSVIAMCTAQLVISTAMGEPSLLVEDLVVEPSWRRQGIGSKLLKKLGYWGMDRGAGRMQLLADKINSPALEFYDRQGWQRTQLICLRKIHTERYQI